MPIEPVVGSGKTLLRVLGFVAVLPAFSAAPAFATTPAPTTTSTTAPGLTPKVSQQLNSLAQRDEEVTSTELNLLNQMQTTKASLASITAKESGIDTRVQSGQAQLATAQHRLDVADSKIEDAQANLAQVQAELVSARDDVRREAIAAYIGRPAADLGPSLSDPASTTSALDRLSYLASLENTQQQAVDRLIDLGKQSVALQRDLRTEESSAKAARDGLQAQLAQLTVARQQQETLRQAAVAAGQQQATLIAQLQAQKTTVEAQIEALAAQSANIATELHALQAGESISASTIAAAKGLFGVPIPGAPITSGFGPRIDPFYGDVRVHTGIDFGAPTGTPIHASAGGTVIVAGVVSGYGNCTIIDDGSGFATLYGHQSALLVHPGQKVIAGEVIGLVGMTGFATGPHLHFEIRVNGTPVDPMPFLALPPSS